jgi:hypothetical protein
MRLKRGEQPQARAQVEGPQAKYICIKRNKKSTSGYSSTFYLIISKSKRKIQWK